VEDYYDVTLINKKLKIKDCFEDVTAEAAGRMKICYTSLSSIRNLIIPRKNAAVINPYVGGLLDTIDNTFGWVPMDFPTDHNINAIIEQNGINLGQCCFYPEINYGGSAVCLSSDMPDLTTFDNQISSWRCSEGFYAILYKDPNYGGDHLTTTCGEQTPAASSSYNNTISSIKIRLCDPAGLLDILTGWCCFYTNTDYTGNYFCTPYSLSIVAVLFRNCISSWKCNGPSVTFYSLPGNTGDEYSTNCMIQGALPTDWCTKIQSLIIDDDCDNTFALTGEPLRFAHVSGETIVHPNQGMPAWQIGVISAGVFIFVVVLAVIGFIFWKKRQMPSNEPSK